MGGLPLIDVLVFAAMFVAATAAAAVNTYSAHRGVPTLRPARAVQATLAVMYAGGFIVVLVGWVQPADWSAFFRPISLITWPAVWIIPTVVADRTWRGVEEGIDRLREQIGN